MEGSEGSKVEGRRGILLPELIVSHLNSEYCTVVNLLHILRYENHF